MSKLFDPVTEARPHFPALAQDFIYADNAGGSQCLASVAHTISAYLLNTNVQLGASYKVSVESGAQVAQGSKTTATFIGADSPKSIIYGSNSTQLVENLARSFESTLVDGDEIVVAEEHETNVGPWAKMVARLAEKGIKVGLKYWRHDGTVEEENVRLSLETLGTLVGEKTKLVAFSACSNLLGELTDIEGAVKLIKAKSGGKARTCLDCVAFSPHRRMKASEWGVDFLFFSYYKVYGPHCSILYAHPDAIATLSSLAHYFLTLAPTDPYKLSPGGSPYELTSGSVPVSAYLSSLSTIEGTESEKLDQAFERMADHEELLAKELLDWLTAPAQRERGVKIVGPKAFDKVTRAPTVSFVVRGSRPLGSKSIVDELDKTGKIGIRYGNFYAVRLLNQIGVDEDDGVVRISMVHYSTLDEVRTIIAALTSVFA